MDDAERKALRDADASPRQQRVWRWLQWCYGTPKAKAERADVPPIGPNDAEWLEQALAKLDELD